MREIHTVKIIPELRKIKPKGADIVEAISFFHDDNLLKTHILASGLSTPVHDTVQDSQTDSLDDFFNRRCLGQADDKTAYFIDASGRLENIRLKSLNKNVLMTYCPLSFWEQYYSTETKYGYRIQWDSAISDVIQRSQDKDFDPDTTLGRGAWRNKDGSFCYHDGIDTIGVRDNAKHYLRKQKKDIGIEDEPASIELCQAIGRIALQMTFETKLDAIRTLSWSCLAPFAGALPWRPAVLLTGSSESGKTTIINTIITKIGIPQFYNGAETTPAGLRVDLGNDACGVVFDETEGKEKAQKNREELFLVMRQSTSDDAPKICKSNKDQGIVKYEMKNMFLFSSIHAGIEDEADEKRILRVNIKKTKKHEDRWSGLESEINKLITEENCRAIRALTWKRLDEIIRYAKELQHIIRRVTGLSSRSAFAEALIMSCYFLIWQGQESVTDEYAEATIASVYMHHEKEDRNESREVLDRILDETVFLPDARENKTLREMLIAIHKNDTEGKQKEYNETLERHGLRLITEEDGRELLAIQKDNVNISKNMNLGGGYSKILWRHNNVVERSRRVRMSGALRTCVIISGVFDE